ncbi:hypothetical protein D1871_02445 [Nakamurella silvestris]|nr:hypothetical protein D1871_02445 [Nakamurella silvestris]
MSDRTVTFNHLGNCIINADQTGTDDYVAASTKTQQIAVGAAAQAISITTPLPDAPVVGDALDLAATGGASGNVVTFSTTTTGICTVTGTTVTFDHVGDCLINADQTGTTDYTAAPTATRSVTIGQAPQAISFTTTEPDTAVVGDSYEVAAVGGALRSNPVNRSLAADGSGEPVTFSTTSPEICTVSGSTVTFDHVGDCLINADQAGDDDYTAAPTIIQTVTVGQAPQAISFTTTEPEAPVVGQTHTVAATGGPSGNEVTFSTPSAEVCTVNGATVTFTHPGDCVVNADQVGNDDYTAAPTTTQTLTIGKAPQTVEFSSTPPSDAKAGDTYEPVATGGTSGTPVVFSIDPAGTPGACEIVAGKVLFTGPGTCIITAEQAGDADHLPTTSQQTVTVAAGEVTITTEALPHGAVGLDYTTSVQAEGGLAPYAWAVAAGSLPDGLALDPDSGDITGTPTQPGAFTFTISATDSENQPVAGTRAFTLTVLAEEVLPPVVDPPTGPTGEPTTTPVPTTGSTTAVTPGTTTPGAPGTTPPPPTALPATGVNTLPLILLGLVLLVAGLLLNSRIGRNRHQH